jgi:hypothetical protein
MGGEEVKISMTPDERWERGIPHHPKSMELYEFIADMDFAHGGDFFCFKSGGDGDNGEILMYYMDEYFETHTELEGKK